MQVISLFDGLGGARIALDNLGAHNVDYYASEVDKAAMAIAKFNYPNINFVGDITELKVGPKCPKSADLLIGGSPCQDLSVAGPKTGLQGKRSGLLYEYIRILEDVQPKYFVLENVASMKKAHQAQITALLGVDPITINSSSFTPQNRKRLFWTNINVESPTEDRVGHIIDIWDRLEPCQHPMNIMTPWGNGKLNKQGFNCIGIIPESIKSAGNYFPRERVFHIDGLARALTTIYSQTPWYSDGNSGIRKLTSQEAEALQGLPNNYTNIPWKSGLISKAKRFHAIGNGFTVPVIEHILKEIV